MGVVYYTHTIGEWTVNIVIVIAMVCIVSMHTVPYGNGIYTYHRGVEGKHCYSEMVCIVSMRAVPYGSGIYSVGAAVGSVGKGR